MVEGLASGVPQRVLVERVRDEGVAGDAVRLPAGALRGQIAEQQRRTSNDRHDDLAGHAQRGSGPISAAVTLGPRMTGVSDVASVFRSQVMSIHGRRKNTRLVMPGRVSAMISRY